MIRLLNEAVPDCLVTQYKHLDNEPDLPLQMVRRTAGR